MEGTNGQHKKLFKYYLDQQIQQRDNRPLFFRRMMRWRVNSKEYAKPFSKKGLLRGYIKYGAFAYMSYYYAKQALFAPAHHGHGHHGHDDHHGHGHQDAKHHDQGHKDDHHDHGHKKDSHDHHSSKH